MLTAKGIDAGKFCTIATLYWTSNFRAFCSVIPEIGLKSEGDYSIAADLE